jgi:hypothetical protein
MPATTKPADTRHYSSTITLTLRRHRPFLVFAPRGTRHWPHPIVAKSLHYQLEGHDPLPHTDRQTDRQTDTDRPTDRHK